MSYPGVCRVAQEGEKLGLWQFVRLEGRVEIPPADLYILGAWNDVYDQLLRVLPGKVGVCWTSSVGEMNLAGYESGQAEVEYQYLARILKDSRVKFIWFGDPSLAQVFPEKGLYSPYPIYLPLSSLSFSAAPEPPRDYMTFFCPHTLKKNALNNLLGAYLIQQETGYILRTNVPVPDLLPIKHVYDGWLPEDRYQAVIRQSALNLACSWSETLHYQAVEAALYKVPSVGSRTIPWLPKEFVVDNPNDSRDISRLGL